jgi:regulator of sigma E protease
VPASFVSTWELMVLLKQSIGGMISAGAAPELSGPIGIAQMTGEVSRDGGLSGWLSVGILLSINLAIINILPFPMLDGGRIVFVVIEWVRRGKRISPEKEGLIHLVGLAVIIAGVVAISANDIARLIQGGTFLGG